MNFKQHMQYNGKDDVFNYPFDTGQYSYFREIGITHVIQAFKDLANAKKALEGTAALNAESPNLAPLKVYIGAPELYSYNDNEVISAVDELNAAPGSETFAGYFLSGHHISPESPISDEPRPQDFSNMDRVIRLIRSRDKNHIVIINHWPAWIGNYVHDIKGWTGPTLTYQQLLDLHQNYFFRENDNSYISNDFYPVCEIANPVPIEGEEPKYVRLFFPEKSLYLCIDGSDVKKVTSEGSGVVYGDPNPTDDGVFRMEKISDTASTDPAVYAIASVKYPNVYLRMDGREGRGLQGAQEGGFGRVNCQLGAGLFERFTTVINANGGSIRWAGGVDYPVFLRMDGRPIPEPSAPSRYIVNCQSVAAGWERIDYQKIDIPGSLSSDYSQPLYLNCLWYNSLELIRRASLTSGKPLIPYVRFSIKNHSDIYRVHHLRAQVYINLLYGAQGIQYFSAIPVPLTENPPEFIRQIQKDLHSLEEVFLGTRILFVSHAGGLTPPNTQPFLADVSQPDRPYPYTGSPHGGPLNIIPVPPVRSFDSNGIAAVVSLIADNNKRYLAVVNRDIHHEMPLTIQFDQPVALRHPPITAPAQDVFTLNLCPGDICVFSWLHDPYELES